MLHGDIKVNGAVIGEWTARRLQHPPRTFNDYECTLTYIDIQGYPCEAEWTLRAHEFGSGAISLGARVMQEGMLRAKRKVAL